MLSEVALPFMAMLEAALLSKDLESLGVMTKYWPDPFLAVYRDLWVPPPSSVLPRWLKFHIDPILYISDPAVTLDGPVCVCGSPGRGAKTRSRKTLQ